MEGVDDRNIFFKEDIIGCCINLSGMKCPELSLFGQIKKVNSVGLFVPINGTP
jgi:hypothetical protein